MKEALLYGLAAIASLFIFGYSIHMFVGGLVSPETERLLIIGGCVIAAGAMVIMARDVIKRRQANDRH